MANDPFAEPLHPSLTGRPPVVTPVTGRNSEAMHVGSEHVRSGMPTGQRLSRMARKVGDALMPNAANDRRQAEARTQSLYGQGGLADRARGADRSMEAQATQERSNATNQAGYGRDAGKYVNDMLKTPGDIFNAPEPDSGRLDPNRRPDKFA
jgi:hypothetical protein